MKLKDRIAIVAGGGQGIGRGIAVCLAEEGADVAVIDINEDAAKEVAQMIGVRGRTGLPVRADLTREQDVNKAVEHVAKFFGRVDILVNNVGGVSQQMLDMTITPGVVTAGEDATVVPLYMYFTPSLWDQYYELNLKSHVMLCRAVAPYFIRQRSGKIVNISSVAGRQGEPQNIPYAAMKAADISLTWSLAKDLARYNINVNCVCPGLVYTPLWERGAKALLGRLRDIVEGYRRKGEKLPPQLAYLENVELDELTPRDFWLRYIVLPSVPLQREQTPEDIGRAVVFLVSEDASNITGQILHVDGGLVMR